MTDTAYFSIEGWDDLERACRDVPEIAMPIAKKAMRRTVEVVTGIVEEYPPATEANRPGRVDAKGHPLGYYERGRGWWRPVKGAVNMGVFGNKSQGKIFNSTRKWRKTNVAGYKLVPVSEQLGRSFSTRVRKDGMEIIGVIGNRASYAVHVVGPASAQARLMAARGWKSITRALDEASDDIDAIWGEDAMDELAQAWSTNNPQVSEG